MAGVTTLQQAEKQLKDTGQYYDPMDHGMRNVSATDPQGQEDYLRSRGFMDAAPDRPVTGTPGVTADLPGPMVGDPGLAGGPTPTAPDYPTAAGAPDATQPPAAGMSAPPTTPGAGWAEMTQNPPSGQLGVSTMNPGLSMLATMGKAIY